MGVKFNDASGGAYTMSPMPMPIDDEDDSDNSLLNDENEDIVEKVLPPAPGKDLRM